jgi:cephalosporin hydroxylase
MISDPLLSGRFQKYVFVNLDGPHDTESVYEEVDFFAHHVLPGGYIIIDDFSLEDEIGPMLESRLPGWKLVNIPNGIMCRRLL